ncbi:bifunctional riboflavin kinase/FMN adenylyltransferase [Candidatus Tenderia electrophaga]|jgi:riboflavin kinase/FMN adenylyltransferase|uniref:Riboflavin biosynthesis protein n=1 Tax=Candidatus Tenderia electrophaga TaxID=1748243 RepID=A0A0S2T9M4_9GAMM|nr:bifunctional riboflavin kinase/FMN adenylyltransferase [Candidatus Tenderia electrophaga]
MELIRGIHNLQPRQRGCVATIGNFDGVHLGHQAVLGQLAEAAGRLDLPTVVITFEPQPQEYFGAAAQTPRLTRLREKLQALRRYSVDRVLCLPFNRRLAAWSAQEFIHTLLVQGLGVKYLVVGDDFRFGHQRRGDFASLKQAGESYGFQVVSMHSFHVDGERVSSTRVREALAQGDMRTAEKLLGRTYRMSGRVARGDQRGRELGFPTANIHLHRQATPVRGVFAVEMFGVSGEPVAGVANVGTRPTVDGTRTLLEVNLFDFDADIYGAYVEVVFLHKLRDEVRFASLEALKQQIALDVEAAQWFFARR